MPLDAIKQVAEAENKAKVLKQEAYAQGKRLISEAQEKGKAMLESARLKAEDEAAALIERAKAPALKQSGEITAQADREIALLKAKAEGRLPQAVQMIVERIVNG